jgi:hypothetical protein
MLRIAMFRREKLQHQKEMAQVKYRAAKLKAKLRGLEAKNTKRAFQAACIYESRVQWVISESEHIEVLPRRTPAYLANLIPSSLNRGNFSPCDWCMRLFVP